MICKKCGEDNDETLKFCGECGASLLETENEESEEKDEKPEKNICPECGHENDLKLKFCGECGAKLSADSQSKEKEEDKPKYSGKNICPKCGKKLSSEAYSCPDCGEPTEKYKEYLKNPKKGRVKRILKMLIIAILVAAAAFGAYLLFTSGILGGGGGSSYSAPTTTLSPEEIKLNAAKSLHDDAENVIKDGLRDPASFVVYSNKMVYLDDVREILKDKAEDDTMWYSYNYINGANYDYIFAIDYGAKNGFGGMNRATKYILIKDNGDNTFNYKTVNDDYTIFASCWFTYCKSYNMQ